MPAQTLRAAFAALAIAGAVALLASACGGDDDKSPDSGTPGAAASRTARASGATTGTPDPDATPGAGDQTPGGDPSTGGTPGAGAGTPSSGDGTPAPGTTPGSTVTMPPPGTTPIPPEPAPPGVAFIAGTASAGVGANATVTITLKGVPSPGIVGYSFEVTYDEGGISRQAGTTAECQFGMGGAPPPATGPAPYAAGCVNLPVPGTPSAACSPGPCVLATIVFRCESAGTHTLTFDPDPDSQAYGNIEGEAVLVPSQNGRVTCT